MVFSLKILALTDFHDYDGIIDSIIGTQERFDVVGCLGDYEFYNEDVLTRVLEGLNQIAPEVLMIPGNMDSPRIIQQFENSKVNLHNRKKVVQNITFVGYGGSNPTPFRTPFELPESEIKRDLEKLCQPTPRDPWVLLTHAPPFNTKVDLTFSGGHVGSKSIRHIIERYSPNVAVCGHIHEAYGIDKLHSTTIINPGAAHDQRAAVIVITPKQTTAKLITI